MEKLGYTFYPKDWWTSDTFFKLPPELRYLYLEILSLMYMNDGEWEANRYELTKRFGVDPGDKGWEVLADLFTVEGKVWTHQSVNKRLRKALASRENGQLGGRPKTQRTQENNLQKPALEREEEREIKTEREEKIESEMLSHLGIDFCTDKLVNDDHWLHSIRHIAKGKDLGGAVRSSFAYLESQPARFKLATLNDLKKTTLSWLENKKPVTPDLKALRVDQKERLKNL